MPTVVDGIDNAVARAYAAAPDRLYLVAKDGTIAYRGGRGPWGFQPDELERAIQLIVIPFSFEGPTKP